MLEAYIAITFISDMDYEALRIRMPEYQVAYVLNRQEQLVHGLTSTTDEDEETTYLVKRASVCAADRICQACKAQGHRGKHAETVQSRCSSRGIGLFFLHEEVNRMLQSREFHPLDEIPKILDDAKAEYEASNQKLPTGNEVKKEPNDYRAFVLEKFRGSTSDEKSVEADDEVCIDSGASIHIERKRLSTSKWIKPNHDSATKVTGIDQVPLRVYTQRSSTRRYLLYHNVAATYALWHNLPTTSGRYYLVRTRYRSFIPGGRLSIATAIRLTTT
jgi:hypothetical protein